MAALAPEAGDAARATAPGGPAEGEAALAGPVDLPALEAAALARHPRLVDAAHRVRALAARARAEGSLPAPEIMAELWQVPLSRPYAVDEAGMLMISVRQQIPAVGSLDRAAEATALEARAGAAMVASQARALLREVDRAFADYAEATARHASHLEHLALLEQMAGAARARFSAGAPLSDVTKADLEQARMQADIARERASIQEARTLLNALMARAVDAPLGPPRLGDAMTVKLTAAEVTERALAENPEVTAADAMRRAAQASAAAADREGSVPSFMVGLNYFHPVGEMPTGWGASLGMSLPWLWGAASARAESAEHRARAESASTEGARLRVQSEAARALATVRGATHRLALLRERARPAVRRALDATLAGYAAGGTDILTWLDAERSSLDVELEISRARGDLDRALADLDWAAGRRVPRVPIHSSVETQHEHE